jgi:AcrR family transcriptional regulator
MGRKSKADERKVEILEHFYEVMREIGFENASIAKIADRMGVNPSLLIHYFKTKEEMVVEMVDFLLERYETTYLTQITEIEDPKARFEKVLNIVLGEDWIQTSGHHSVFYACYYLASRHQLIQERFKLMYNRFREVLEAEAKIWFESGVINTDDAAFVADYLIMLNEGLTYMEGIYQDIDSFRTRAEKTRKMVKRSLT